MVSNNFSWKCYEGLKYRMLVFVLKWILKCFDKGVLFVSVFFTTFESIGIVY